MASSWEGKLGNMCGKARTNWNPRGKTGTQEEKLKPTSVSDYFQSQWCQWPAEGASALHMELASFTWSSQDSDLREPENLWTWLLPRTVKVSWQLRAAASAWYLSLVSKMVVASLLPYKSHANFSFSKP